MKKKNIVKSSQGKVYLIISVVLILGWLLSIALIVSGNKDEKAQLTLVQQAEEYLKDDIYIRAINSLKNALEYDTEHNREIEDKLLNVYKEGKFTEDYEELARQRIEKGYAKEEEFLNVSASLVRRDAKATAVAILKQATANYPENTDLLNLYDKVRFEISVWDTDYNVYINPIEMQSVPVFDGDKWGFSDIEGKLIIPQEYDEVHPFFGKYAIVKKKSQYELIDTSQNRWALDKIGIGEIVECASGLIVAKTENSYSIYSLNFKKKTDASYDDVLLNANGLICVKNGGKWAILDSEFKPITDYIFTDIVRNSRGQAFQGNYAVAADDRGYFIVNDQGKPIFDNRFEGAKGYEGGNIAVTDGSGKWGYANGKGELIIPFKYSDAKSFSCSLAAVYEAGNWNYINSRDMKIIEGRYAAAEPFDDGIAIVKDELDYVHFIKLKYYEYYK